MRSVKELRLRTLPGSWVWIALILLAPAFLFLPVTHDAIWQIWLGREMLHGARLYSDLIEVNPPLWFWIAVPLAAFGAEARVTVIAFFLLAIALSLYLSPARYRPFLLPALLILPLHDFGQREHFALIATAPYVFLIAQRSDGAAVRHPVAIALFAAVGFALKPWFALVPLALELMVRKRIRPETVTLALCAVAYPVAVLVFAPDYLTKVVPMVRAAYPSFLGSQSFELAFLTFAAALVGVGDRRGSSATRALAIAALCFLPAFIIQGKGWAYHSIPARGFLFLAIIIELFRARRNPFADAFLAAAAFLCFEPIGVYYNTFRGEMERHLAGVPRGSSVVVIASNPSTAWPMVEEHGLKWQLREFSAWQIAAVIQSPKLKPQLTQIVDDALAKHPDILVIDQRPILGPAAMSLVPPSYLDGYRQKLRTRRFVSYSIREPEGTKP